MKSSAIGFYGFPNLKHNALYIPQASRKAGGVKGLLDRYYEWRNRLQTRQELMRLSEYQLRDIGLSRYDAEREWEKPFWRG